MHATVSPPVAAPSVATQQLAAVTLVLTAAYAAALPALGFIRTDIATCLCIAAAALLSGIAGFAFSAICGAMLFQFRHDTVQVVQIMLVCSIANQSLSVSALRHDISPVRLLPFLAGGLAGLPVGIWLLLDMQAHTYIRALGIILFGYGLYTLLRHPIVLRRAPRIGDVLAGLAGGLMGGFAATPGAAFTIPAAAWAYLPASLAGTCWGLAWFRRLTDRQFSRAVNVLLLVSGAGLAV